MNRIININLNGVIFDIEENAHETLKVYLNSVKEHFKNFKGHEEIITDIELGV